MRSIECKCNILICNCLASCFLLTSGSLSTPLQFGFSSRSSPADRLQQLRPGPNQRKALLLCYFNCWRRFSALCCFCHSLLPQASRTNERMNKWLTNWINKWMNAHTFRMSSAPHLLRSACTFLAKMLKNIDVMWNTNIITSIFNYSLLKNSIFMTRSVKRLLKNIAI